MTINSIFSPINYGFITGSYHTFPISTMRLLCDYYKISMWFISLAYLNIPPFDPICVMRIFNKFAPRITSTASATTFYSYISMCANCDFCENIAWVFGVNRVFGVFLIYPIYPKNPKYYLFIFYSPFLQAIRITDSFSFDYADLPCRLIALSPPSTDFLRTHSQPSSKVRRNLSLITYSS